MVTAGVNLSTVLMTLPLPPGSNWSQLESALQSGCGLRAKDDKKQLG
jgi:hypothetical protein